MCMIFSIKLLHKCQSVCLICCFLLLLLLLFLSLFSLLPYPQLRPHEAHAVVKQIIDGPRCAQLRENDLITEVNGEKVSNYSHNDFLGLLEGCPKGSQGHFLVVRSKYCMYVDTLLTVREKKGISMSLNPILFSCSSAT